MVIVSVLVFILIFEYAYCIQKESVGKQEEYVVTKTAYTEIKFQPSRLPEIIKHLKIKDIREVDVLYKEVFILLKKRLKYGKEILCLVGGVGVTIYPHPFRVKEEYRKRGGKFCLVYGFYMGDSREIYTSLWHLSRGHLGHEFTHHILKWEFGLDIPDEEKEEELARFVAGCLR